MQLDLGWKSLPPPGKPCQRARLPARRLRVGLEGQRQRLDGRRRRHVRLPRFCPRRTRRSVRSALRLPVLRGRKTRRAGDGGGLQETLPASARAYGGACKARLRPRIAGPPVAQWTRTDSAAPRERRAAIWTRTHPTPQGPDPNARPPTPRRRKAKASRRRRRPSTPRLSTRPSTSQSRCCASPPFPPGPSAWRPAPCPR